MAFALIGKLLDIEWLLRRDEGRSSAELLHHDRVLLGPAAPANAEQALELWLAGRRRELGGLTLGARASELLTALHVSLVGVALLAGAGTAQALLHTSTKEPTNVLSFMAATLIGPLALLASSLCLLGLRGRFGRSVLIEDIYLVGLGALGRLSRRARQAEGEGWDVAREWRVLRRSGRRYRDLEVATLLSAAQWYPLAFHVGAAFALTGSALFSDLAFAWSTTNDSLQPHTLAAVFRVAAAPWCETLTVGCVSRELVEATQFSRFSAQYAEPHGAWVSGAWWPALLGCLLLYGVLPRLLFSLGLSGLVSRRTARLGERVLELRGRLHGVTVNVSPPPPQADGSSSAAPVAPASASQRELPCWLIRWRGASIGSAELEAVCLRLRLRVERRDVAGDGGYERDEALLHGASAEVAAVLLLAEGWEAPDKATRRFIEALRKNLALPVFVGVLLENETTAEGAAALGIWRDRLRLLEDPGVSVESIALGRSSGAEEARP